MSQTTALSDAGFRRYYVASVAGVNGMWIFRVLMSWAAWDMTASPSFVGLVAAASLLPVALIGPILGAVADRANILRAQGYVSVGMLSCPLAMLVLMWAGLFTPPVLLVLSLGFGVVISAYHPVRQSIGPRLVPRPLIGSVVALSALNFNLGRMISPAIGGVLIDQAGMQATSIVSVLLFLPNLAVLRQLAPRDSRGQQQQALWRDFIQGLRLGWGAGPIRQVLILTILGLGPIRAVMELLALIADGTFGRGASGLGLLTSAVGGGALCAALLQVLAGQRLFAGRMRRSLVLGVGYLTTLALVFAPGFELALVWAVVAGFCATSIGVALQVELQHGLEDNLRGRIMSLWMLSVTLSTSLMAMVISAASELWGLDRATLVLLVLSFGILAVLSQIRAARA